MKSVLVYGDSNTWGQTAEHSRYDYDVLWTSQLCYSFHIYSAGVSGRIAGSYDNVPPVKRGKDSFVVVYRQAFPVDAVIIALGTNDIKQKYDIDTNDIIVDLLWYVDQVESLIDYNHNTLEPKILFVLPPNFDQDKFEGSENKRRDIIKSMQASGYETLSLGDIGMSNDGVHFSAKGHQQVAYAVRLKLKELGL